MFLHAILLPGWRILESGITPHTPHMIMTSLHASCLTSSLHIHSPALTVQLDWAVVDDLLIGCVMWWPQRQLNTAGLIRAVGVMVYSWLALLRSAASVMFWLKWMCTV
jgi:hypothetical protein